MEVPMSTLETVITFGMTIGAAIVFVAMTLAVPLADANREAFTPSDED